MLRVAQLSPHLGDRSLMVLSVPFLLGNAKSARKTPVSNLTGTQEQPPLYRTGCSQDRPHPSVDLTEVPHTAQEYGSSPHSTDSAAPVSPAEK